MFKKILIVEDLNSTMLAIAQVLNDLSVSEIHQAEYCDDALLKIKKALNEKVPYDLLIIDLSFKIDHRGTTLNSGEELIAAVKKIQPDIKTIVFSIEDKSYRIKSLYNNLQINAYVSKGRDSISRLKQAINSVFITEEKIISADWSNIFKDNSILEIEEYDITLLKLLSKGLSIDEISFELKNTGTTPNSSSSIEKRLNKIKIYFKAKNNVHLIAISKDLGVL